MRSRGLRRILPPFRPANRLSTWKRAPTRSWNRPYRRCGSRANRREAATKSSKSRIWIPTTLTSRACNWWKSSWRTCRRRHHPHRAPHRRHPLHRPLPIPSLRLHLRAHPRPPPRPRPHPRTREHARPSPHRRRRFEGLPQRHRHQGQQRHQRHRRQQRHPPAAASTGRQRRPLEPASRFSTMAPWSSHCRRASWTASSSNAWRNPGNPRTHRNPCPTTPSRKVKRPPRRSRHPIAAAVLRYRRVCGRRCCPELPSPPRLPSFRIHPGDRYPPASGWEHRSSWHFCCAHN